MIKRLNKINLLLPLFLFGLFFIGKSAQATTLIDVNVTNAGGTYMTGWVNVMQGFKPNVNNINSFSITGYQIGANTLTADFYICKGTTTQSQLIYNSRATSTEVEYGCGTTSPNIRILKATSSVFTENVINGMATATITFPTKQLEPNQPYYFVLHYLSGQGNMTNSLNFNNYLATSSDLWFYNVWWNGQQRQTDNSGGTTGVDMPFVTWYDKELNSGLITITRPTVGERVYDNQPITIAGNIYNPNIRYNSGVIKILNKQTWTALDDIFIEITSEGGNFEFTLPYTQLGAGNFRIYANLIDSNTGIIGATSNKVDFVIGTNTIYTGTDDSQYVIGGQATEAQICAGITSATSSFMYSIECGGRKLIYNLFTPNVFALETLKTSWINFKGKFPFSVYFQLTDTVQSAIDNSSVNMNDTFDVVMIDKDRDIITVPVLSSSSVANLVGQSNADLIRNTIGWIIWLAVAFLIFLTFKNI